ncbi:hypothetical protein [Micromonospora zhanjiangensis]|uniref:Uncharacterized protein n=1 Tax=Micromonospora zhanjiangensis TaxID=1522057 RepID=A0ABV8KRY5_9ACTN
MIMTRGSGGWDSNSCAAIRTASSAAASARSAHSAASSSVRLWTMASPAAPTASASSLIASANSGGVSVCSRVRCTPARASTRMLRAA